MTIKLLKIFPVFGIIIGMFFSMQAWAQQQTPIPSPEQKDIVKKLEVAMNQGLPREIFTGVVLERITMDSVRSVTNHYLVGPNTNKEKVRDIILTTYSQNMCKSPAMRKEIESGSSNTHLFKSKDGKVFLKIVIDKTFCGKFKI